MRSRWPLLVVVVLLVGATAGCLREFEDPHHLSIANVDLAPVRVLAGEVVVELITTLDNRGGGDSGQIRLLAKAYDEGTGFLLTQNETQVGAIEEETTRRVAQRLAVPREGSVRFEVSLYEDEQGSQRASVVARNLGALKPEVYETGLKIGEMDFTVQSANGSRPRIQASLYFTNEAQSASEDLRVQVKAREVTTGLVADTAWLDTGVILPGTTVIRSTNLSVPDGYNYVVEILTWRGDVIVDRAEGRVQLAPTFERPKDQELVVTNPNLEDFASRGALSPTAPTSRYTGDYPPASEVAGVPGLPLAGLGIAVAIAAAVFGRRNGS